jgi:small ligand-binding sensory domain FIST
LIGCVVAGVIADSIEVEDGPSMSLWAATWNETVSIESFHLTATNTPDGPSLFGWPDTLLDADPKRSVMLLMGDPFTLPVNDLLLPHVNDVHPGLRVVGGMASGANAPGQTTLLAGNRVVNHGGIGVLLRGLTGLEVAVSQGCRPIGRRLIITKGRGNVIEELSGLQPVVYIHDLYHELPPEDQKLFRGGLHIGMAMSEYRESFGRGDFLIRNLHRIDPETGAVMVTDRVRVGQSIQFQLRDATTAHEDLVALLQGIKDRTTKIGSCLLFSCNGRGSRMFGAPNHDAKTIQKLFGPIPLSGFFASGELGPVGEKNYIHGFTVSAALFAE